MRREKRSKAESREIEGALFAAIFTQKDTYFFAKSTGG
jgi:hypothetical protein